MTMTLSLAVAPTPCGRRGGGVLIGTGLATSSPRHQLEHGLLFPFRRHQLPRGGSGCGLRSSGGSVWNGVKAKATTGNTEKSSTPLALGRYPLSPSIVHRNGKTRGNRVVCAAAAGLDIETLQWVSSIACLVLMLAKGTTIHKSFLPPLFALQAPSSIISWVKGEYGCWTAFLALMVRLFYFIPGELDLPYLTMLLIIVGPHQAMMIRETKSGAIVSLVIAGYLLFQHISGAAAGGIQKAFDRGSVVATLAVLCLTTVTCLLLF